MFLPITTVARVDNLEQAMKHANDVNYGLTAGFYGTPEEANWFFENIEAGVHMPTGRRAPLREPGLASSHLAGGRVLAHLVKTAVDITMYSSTCTSRSGL